MAGFSFRHWKAFRAGRGIPGVQAPHLRLTKGCPQWFLSILQALSMWPNSPSCGSRWCQVSMGSHPTCA